MATLTAAETVESEPQEHRTSDQQDGTGRNDSRYTARIYCAPILLCVIAAVQFFNSHASHLSKWKGGGFGMFSTVDSHRARFLRIYLITKDGEIPINVPSPLVHHASKLKTWPTPNRAKDLVRGLATFSWGDLNATWRNAAHRRASVEPDSSMSIDEFYPGFDVPDLAYEAVPGVRTTVGAIGQSAPNATIDVEGFRVEVWKFQFNRDTKQLTAVRILQVVTNREAKE